jgi:hypothetical protein
VGRDDDALRAGEPGTPTFEAGDATGRLEQDGDHHAGALTVRRELPEF